MEDILVPITFFAIVPFSIWAVSHYRYKARAKIAETLQGLVAAGQTIDPELIKSLGMPAKRPHADLRAGLIAIAIGLGFAVLGNNIAEPDAGPALLSIGAFPIFIGIALIGFWALISRKTD